MYELCTKLLVLLFSLHDVLDVISLNQAQVTTVIKLWAKTHGEDISIGEVLVKEGLAAVTNKSSDPCSSGTVATSSKAPAIQMTVRDLETTPKAVPYVDVWESHVASIQEEPSEADPSLSVDVLGSSAFSTQKQASEVVRKGSLSVDEQTSCQGQAFESGAPHKRDAQTSTDDLEATLSTLSCRGVQGSSATSILEQPSGEGLPNTRNTDSN